RRLDEERRQRAACDVERDVLRIGRDRVEERPVDAAEALTDVLDLRRRDRDADAAAGDRRGARDRGPLEDADELREVDGRLPPRVARLEEVRRVQRLDPADDGRVEIEGVRAAPEVAAFALAVGLDAGALP